MDPSAIPSDYRRRFREWDDDDEGSGMESTTAGEGRDVLKAISKYWWLWLVFGVAWMVVAAVILQFDEASVTTVGAIIGFMFLGAAVQQFAIAGLVDRGKWLFAIFGVLFVGA